MLQVPETHIVRADTVAPAVSIVMVVDATMVTLSPDWGILLPQPVQLDVALQLTVPVVEVQLLACAY